MLLIYHQNIEDFDRSVSAKLPDPKQQPELFKLVLKCILHSRGGNLLPNVKGQDHLHFHSWIQAQKKGEKKNQTCSK